MIRTTLLILLLFAIFGCGRGERIVKESPYYRTHKGAWILAQADAMIEDGVVVRGSCWDYVDAVYNSAGATLSKRVRIFGGSRQGPYAPIELIEPGDWLYFINTAYHNVEHSAIFVKWIDKRRGIAKCISYPGMKRHVPGRYSNYYLGKVFRIVRYE